MKTINKNINDKENLPASQLIKLQNITKFYGQDKVLDDVSINIEKNKVTALIGPNGAGKTTLIKIMLSLIDYDSGYVNFSKNIKFAYAPENSRLYPELTVGYFLQWISKVKKISNEKLKNYIDIFELYTHLNKKIKFLSKGYKRRLIVLQSLLGDENFIVLDEPSDGLDIEFKFKLSNILKSIKKLKTILICSHESLILSELTDKIIILNKGRIIFDGNANNLKNSDGKLYIEDIYLRFKKDEKNVINK